MRRLVVWLVVLGLLIGALVGVDAWARGYTEDRAAGFLQSELGVDEKPTVTVGGWPFLYGALSNNLPEVRVRAERVPVTISDQKMTVRDIDFLANHLSREGAELLIGEVTGTTRMPFDELGGLAGGEASHAGGGRLKVIRTMPLFGQSITTTVTGTPQVDEANQTVSLVKVNLDVAGVTLNEQLSQQLMDKVAKPIPIDLPKGLKLREVTVTDAGLVMRADGKELRLPFPG